MPIAAPTGGAIIADAAYPLPDFQQITGLRAKSIRRMKREGLRVVYQGRRTYIIGRDFLEYLEKTGQTR